MTGYVVVPMIGSSLAHRSSVWEVAVSDPSIRTNPHRPHIEIDAGRLWGGGLATACVAALVAVAGVMICQYVLDILVRPALLLDVAKSFRLDYALTAFLLALVATGLAHGLALATPRPRAFFGWIMGLATVCGRPRRSRSATNLRARSPRRASTSRSASVSGRWWRR